MKIFLKFKVEGSNGGCVTVTEALLEFWQRMKAITNQKCLLTVSGKSEENRVYIQTYSSYYFGEHGGNEKARSGKGNLKDSNLRWSSQNSVESDFFFFCFVFQMMLKQGNRKKIDNIILLL